MGTKEAEDKLLEELRGAPKSKRELKKAIKAKHPTLKKHFKKAMKQLKNRGIVLKDGDTYNVSTPSTKAPSVVEGDKTIVPIAMKLRQDVSAAKPKSVGFVEPEEPDIDDEIARLERELEAYASSASSDNEDESEEDNPSVLALSKFAEDRVEQLPEQLLPLPGRYDANERTNKRAKAGAKKGGDPTKQKTKPNDGLREAVQEVLNGYKARSSEKLPFYCRFCAKQYNNEDEFFQHKQSEFHKTSVGMERKATFCRLCSKQLTSPAQMKEHLSSRPHKERLHAVKNRQRGGGTRNTGNPRQAKRQWT